MLFNSLTFAVFFAIVLLLHSLPLSWDWKKRNLLLASYLFYAAWNPLYITLIAFSTVVDWIVARRIHASNSPAVKKRLLGISLAANLGLLALFKYADFFAETSAALLILIGVRWSAPGFDLVLPVGISFYTFQTLSYTIDVYRGRLEPGRRFSDYALYVAFFPQLVAGPIVRAATFLPQLMWPKRPTWPGLSWGFTLLVLGLFQKSVLADDLFAPLADALYALPAEDVPTAWAAWMGTAAFAGQIFCDFSGYSSCAIGAALCLGFRIPENFRYPYAARGFSDFWRRWHISLSEWLRDYLYIPLGGNQRGRGRTLRNLVITMGLGGLWHGAAWTFVIWGLLHGAYLVVERVLNQLAGGWRFWRSPAGVVLITAVTFAAVCVAWAFFRADTLAQALAVAGAMLGRGGSATPYQGGPLEWVGLAALAALLLLHFALRGHPFRTVAERVPPTLRGLLIGAMLFLVFITPGGDQAFIYFQF